MRSGSLVTVSLMPKRLRNINRQNLALRPLLCYEYLIDLDGGYRSVKVAEQYQSQVLSIIRTCKMHMKQTESNPKQYEHEDLHSFHLLLISGTPGVKFLRSWLSYVVEKYPAWDCKVVSNEPTPFLKVSKPRRRSALTKCRHVRKNSSVSAHSNRSRGKRPVLRQGRRALMTSQYPKGLTSSKMMTS